ncbi:MAG: hypothetical protein DRG78_02395 [Epsilonproteobacteria bacterium]|nr:MAG: hypothetical protein DRG78_02395 [Campylobacterota bacterium]
MAEIMINDKMFLSGERSSSADETNFIKNNQGVYYNTMEGAVYILDSLADSLSKELAVILFVVKDSIVMAFANNPEAEKATTIEFKMNKDNKSKDLKRLKLALLRYCMIYSTDNSFKVVETGRINRTISNLFDDTKLKYEIIKPSTLNHAISKLLKSYSSFEKIRRVAISFSIASLSIFVGLFVNSQIDKYFESIDKKIDKNSKIVRKYKREINIEKTKYEELNKKYEALKYTEYEPNRNILQDFATNFNDGILYIQNFKVVKEITAQQKTGTK